ncbi:hypothetical protein ZIOFF_028612 [Zingiber officinale]|uniref:Acyl-CoA thioesterase II domain-containing protein n=1 Tax=Zingiber officinale TaxID=94328 RepID=A0A8J5GLJ3_ZINOF|nr:hypothetical protein ZIOFF_028612 [Zingiber officinale]
MRFRLRNCGAGSSLDHGVKEIVPIIYQVQRARDGKSFATRQVEARQRGTTIFTLLASFQKVESGFEHQEVLMPCVPGPETLLSMEELRERRITDPRLPMHYRNNVALTKFIPWPIEIKFCDTSDSSKQSHPSLKYWFKARGKLSDDAALHRCVVAYASDLIFSGVSLNPHRRRGVKTASLSLDHSIWFHRPVRADDWLLFVIESPSASGGRGFVTGHMFNKKGERGRSVEDRWCDILAAIRLEVIGEAAQCPSFPCHSKAIVQLLSLLISAVIVRRRSIA